MIYLDELEFRKCTGRYYGEISEWLKSEEDNTGGGFYCNIHVIAQAAIDGEVEVAMHGYEPVAFVMGGDHAIEILSVRPDLRGQGIGDHFTKHRLDVARAAGVSGIEITCVPSESYSFWSRHGFKARASRDFGQLHAFAALYPEPVPVSNGDTIVTASHPRIGEIFRHDFTRADGGTIVFRSEDSTIPAQDIRAKIEVEGRLIFDDKVKRAPRDTGIKVDPRGNYHLNVMEVLI